MLFWIIVRYFQLPLLRWKRFALVAAMCILAVRAVIVQIAFYMHIQVLLCIIFLILILYLWFIFFFFNKYYLRIMVSGNRTSIAGVVWQSDPNIVHKLFQTFVYGRPAVFSRPLIFATAFMSFFSVVIALFKVNAFSFSFKFIWDSGLFRRVAIIVYWENYSWTILNWVSVTD